MQVYLNTHYVLDKRRKLAKEDVNARMAGPRVLVVGNADVGKSSLTRLLLNYAIRTGW